MALIRYPYFYQSLTYTFSLFELPIGGLSVPPPPQKKNPVRRETEHIKEKKVEKEVYIPLNTHCCYLYTFVSTYSRHYVFPQFLFHIPL